MHAAVDHSLQIVDAQKASRLQEEARLFEYALRWRVSGWRAGAHKGREEGRMGEFRRLVPFHRAPDARRLDLRSSLRDPYGNLFVRQVAQRSAADVHVLIDTSASMAFGEGWRLRRARHVAHLFAQATQAIHDRFGLAAGAENLELFEPARRNGARTAFEHLDTLAVGGVQRDGLRQAAERLGRRRCLVVVLSDFEFPELNLEALLVALAGHDVIPIRIGERLREDLPRYGLMALRDMESGQRRLVWLRPSLRTRWQAQVAERRQHLARVFSRHGCRPFELMGALDIGALGRYLREA